MPADVLEAANAEILVCHARYCHRLVCLETEPVEICFPISQALRKRSGNTDTSLEGFPKKYSLA